VQIGIIGAGAVGGVIAALLDRAGHSVEITARGEHLDAIRSHGIALTGAWGDHTARVVAGARLGRPAELVIVTTKAHDTAAALHANLDALHTTPVLVIQNGLAGVTTTSAISPTSPVVGGLGLFATSYVTPGTVTVTAAATTYLGGECATTAGAATEIAHGVLEPVLPVRMLDGADAGTFANAQWTKLIINQINALPAITGLSAQEVIGNRELRLVMTAAMREAVRTGLNAGVRFGSLQGLNNALLTAFARLPLALGQRLPLEIGKRMGSTPNPGSTLQSIRRGQLTEIDFLNGAIVDTARATGRTAPINSALVTLVHDVERGGTFLSPAEVLTRMAITR
jgi:2-dehydropantoate 2-reductase